MKFYLDAPARVRESRRLVQLRAGDHSADAATLRAEVLERDDADRSRAASPLRPAADAHVIDTEALDIDAMVAHALAVCRAAGIAADPS